ncbi:cytochrome P450 [Saccharothrix syringae]|uniref:Cytochrome P450 n=1 Tax=Saccharothrix syringae TaxID=103733 RepID=A0A5Q0H552_SACSY|nr:cytochrome P450 [Saccharothrix syringae]QFZ21279.1 cytochrome P450 [Saccharothrix syringae]
MSFGPIRRADWRALRRLHRRCVRKPVFRTLAGSVVVCDARLARQVLVDGDERLDHVPAFWRPGGVALPPVQCTAWNRWVHRALAAEDEDRAAELAVESLAAARGDLHRACLHAVAEAHGRSLGLDHAELRAVVDEFLDTVFHAMVTGSRRGADDRAFERLCARAAAALADEPVPGLPDLAGAPGPAARPGEAGPPAAPADEPAPGSSDAGPAGPAVRGEMYLRAVTAFVGASAAALTWLVCAHHPTGPIAVRRATDPRDAHPGHVALEALRLWPPAWQHRRPVRHDHRLGTLSVLRGDDVVVPTYALHRHPRHWPDPDDFRPERWENLPDRPDAFLPFAVGPGACVAATSEVRLLGAVAARLADRPLPLTRLGRAPRVTAVLSAPEHVLG